MIQYFDAHTHLQNIPDLPQAMARASQAQVCGFICNATCENDWGQVLQIAQDYQGVYPALGVHPWYVESLKTGWEARLEALLKAGPNVLLGEIGLDKCKPNLDLQEAVLRAELELAFQYKRPVVVHCVHAWDRLLHIFKTMRGKMPPRLLSHSHHGDAALIAVLINEYNAYFSYSPRFKDEKHIAVRTCLKATPAERLLIETDCPDGAKEPAALVELVSKMAAVTGLEESDLKQALFDNAKEFING